VSEVRAGGGNGPSRMTVRALSDRRPSGPGQAGPPQVAGTIDDQGRPLLIAVDGYPVHVSSTGYLLLAYNRDQPGVIGSVGTLLGQAGVNIAFMQVGRSRPGEEAVMVLGLDDPIPDEVARELRARDDLWKVVIARW